MNLIKRLKYKIKRTFIDLLFMTGNESILFNDSGGKSTIAMYHGVDKTENKKFNLRFIGINNLEKQLLYFKKNFNFVSLENFIEKKFKQDKFTICLTFDDGYFNNYKYVYPLAEKYEIPVTFFVTAINQAGEDILWADFFDIFTSLNNSDFYIDENNCFNKKNGKYFLNNTNKTLNEFIKESSDFNRIRQIMKLASEKIVNFKVNPYFDDYWKLMGDKEIKEVSKSKFITIGSHGVHHNRLDLLNHDELLNQLTQSKLYLENITGKVVNALAYPCGYYSKEVIETAEKVGYKYQLAANKDFEEGIEDKRVSGRFGMYPAVSWQNQIYDIVTNS